MSQSSIFIPDAQPDPVREFFKSSSPEIPDSQDSQELEFLKAPPTSRDQRIQIQTALLFKIPHSKIREVLDVTEKQIKYARKHQVTPQKSKRGKKSLLIFLNINS